MLRPRRRLLIGVLSLSLLVLSIAGGRIAWDWKHALDNVDAMIVPTIEIPTQTLHEIAAGDAASAKDGSQLPQLTPQPTAVPAPDDPVNIVLLGTDARLGEEISRTDAILVLHFDPRSNRVSLLSVPRDLWVNIPTYGKARINAAYPIGERKLGPGGGGAMVKRTLSDLLGIPIHHFVMINFEGFQELIDKLGGITIDIPKAITDPKYPTNEHPGDHRWKYVHFEPGVQTLNGENALIYARTRHADNDFGRIQRQQQVLMAIFERMRERGLLTQLTAVDDYTGALRDYIRMDIPRSELLSLATAGPRLRAENIERYTIDSKVIVELKPPATFAADPQALKMLIGEMIGDSLAAGGENPTP